MLFGAEAMALQLQMQPAFENSGEIVNELTCVLTAGAAQEMCNGALFASCQAMQTFAVLLDQLPGVRGFTFRPAERAGGEGGRGCDSRSGSPRAE